MALSKEHVRYLRGMAHTQSPIVMVGNKGVSQTLVTELAAALDRHELVKIRVMAEAREDREQLIEGLLKSAGAELIQRVGHTATLFKRNAKQPKIVLPGEKPVSSHPARADAPTRRASAVPGRSGATGAFRKPAPRFERTPISRESGDFEDRTTITRSPYAKRDASAPTERAPRAERAAYPRREASSFADRGAAGPRQPYVRREAGSERPASAERKPYVRREGGSFTGHRDGAERKPYARREGSSFTGQRDGAERQPYARREGGSFAGHAAAAPRKTFPSRDEAGSVGAERKPYQRREDGIASSGVRRERDRPAFAAAAERKPYARREAASPPAKAGAMRSERGAYVGKSAYGEWRGGRAPDPSAAAETRRPSGYAGRKSATAGYAKPGGSGGPKRPGSSRAEFSRAGASRPSSRPGGSRPTRKP